MPKLREKCKNCKKKIDKPKPHRLFCSNRCRALWHGKHDYYKHKDSSEYKQKAKLRHTRWRKKNRKKFNKLCRDSRVRRKK